MNQTYNLSFSNLFYKVIHNKFLFNLIFHHIHSTEWVSSYVDQKETIFKIDYKFQEKRIKFKDITNLQFIIKNKLFQLLKCKLEADEFIETRENNNKRIKFSDWLNELYISDRELSIDILKLLLKSKSISLEFNLIDYCSLNEELFKIIVDPLSPYSIQIIPSSLKFIFENSELPQIKISLDSFFYIDNNSNNNDDNNSNNNNILKKSKTILDSSLSSSSSSSSSSSILSSSLVDLINEYKNQIIYNVMLIENPFQRDRVLKLVLDNSKYYNIPTTQNNSKKRLMVELDSDNIRKINLKDLIFNIISIKSQSKLLDLNYFYIPSTNYQLIENILNSNNDNYNRIIELDKLFKKDLDFGIDQYLGKYSNEILSSFENLQLFILNNQNDWKQYNSRIEEVIKKSYSNLLLFSPSSLSLDLIYKNEPIFTNEFYNLLKYNKEFNFIKIIIDKYKDRLYQEFYESSSFQIKQGIESLNFSKLELYFKENQDDNKFISYNKTLVERNSIQEFQIIMEINKYLIWNRFQAVYYYLDLLPSDISSNKSSLINFGKEDSDENIAEHILLYGNQNEDIYHHCEIDSSKLLLLWSKVFVTSIKRASKHRMELLLLKFNFNPIIQYPQLFSTLWNENIQDSILDDIQDNLSIFENQSNNNSFTQDSIKFNTQDYSNRNPNDIIEIIKLLLNNFNQYNLQQQLEEEKEEEENSEIIEIDQTEDENNLINFENEIINQHENQHENQQEKMIRVSNTIINYLFRILIQNNGEIQFETINSIYLLINNSKFIRVQESTLFSIYYLSNRSRSFIKYILTSPLIQRLIDEGFTNYYIPDDSMVIDDNQVDVEEMMENLQVFDISEFIDPDIFTFEFIFNSPFDDINDALIMRFMFQFFQGLSNEQHLTPDSINFVNDIVNHTLIYLMDIRRIDLLFGFLELLKDCNLNNFEKYIRFTESFFTVLAKIGDQDLIIEFVKEYKSQFIELLQSENYYIFKYFIEINNIIPFNLSSSIFQYPELVYKYHLIIFKDHDNNNNNNNNQKNNLKIYLTEYPINIYKSLLNHYPNNQYLKLSKESLSLIIKSFSHHKLKQLYQTQLINNQLDSNDQYNDLLSFFKSQLLNHKDLKYLKL